jgi:hypothetical protein
MYATGKLDRYRPSTQYIESLEAEGGFLHGLSRTPGWVMAGSLGHDAWIPVNQVDRDLEDQSQHNEPSTQAFGGFSGFGGSGESSGASSQTGEKNLFPGSGNKLSGNQNAAASSFAFMKTG